MGPALDRSPFEGLRVQQPLKQTPQQGCSIQLIRMMASAALACITGLRQSTEQHRSAL